MQIKAEEISKIIESQIKNYEQRVEMSETGTVLYVGDGIARVYGVQNAMSMELLERAYYFAARMHHGCFRKDKVSLYIIHPLATAAIVACMAAIPEEEPVEMRADRPFAFVIADGESGSVCFAGAIENPVE